MCPKSLNGSNSGSCFGTVISVSQKKGILGMRPYQKYEARGKEEMLQNFQKYFDSHAKLWRGLKKTQIVPSLWMSSGTDSVFWIID